MKRFLFYIVCFIPMWLLSSSITSSTIDVCYGTGYKTAYTIRNETDVCYGTGYKTAYTIRNGTDICEGTSYKTAYTIR